MEGALNSPALALALAMALGVLAQGLARLMQIPGIVVLLTVGVLLGPDGVALVRPEALGDAQSVIVGFAVAVILFEGGLHLRVGRLRSQALAIRRLVTVGAVVTAAGGTLAARLLLGWDWRMSLLFGTLVIVTGPTVITPLLRRVRIKPNVATILDAEGIFIDAIGATIAVVALEVALAPSGAAATGGALDIVIRLAGGGAVGAVGGLLLTGLLRHGRFVPEDLHNVLALAWVVALYQIANAMLHESGLAAAIAAGMVVGNIHNHRLDSLISFKEQLTTLLIATLFVVLAADVRLASVTDILGGGMLVVAVLVVVVRPLAVAMSTAGTGLTWREKAFLGWVAPRGIVAAAVASLFALQLEARGIDGGAQLEALVFLVIAVTVVLQGLSMGLVARLLGLRRGGDTGVLILGANPLALVFADALREQGREVMLIDANADNCRAAEEAGFRVLYGSGLEEATLRKAHASERELCVALTPNASVNLLFAQYVRAKLRGPTVWVAAASGAAAMSSELVEKASAEILFGGASDLDLWIHRVRQGTALRRRFVARLDGAKLEATSAVLPLLASRAGQARLPTAPVAAGDEVELLVMDGHAMEAAEELARAGFDPLPP